MVKNNRILALIILILNISISPFQVRVFAAPLPITPGNSTNSTSDLNAEVILKNQIRLLKNQIRARNNYITALEAENDSLQKTLNALLEEVVNQKNTNNNSVHTDTNAPTAKPQNLWHSTVGGAVTNVVPGTSSGPTTDVLQILKSQIAARDTLISALEKENTGLKVRIEEIRNRSHSEN